MTPPATLKVLISAQKYTGYRSQIMHAQKFPSRNAMMYLRVQSVSAKAYKKYTGGLGRTMSIYSTSNLKYIFFSRSSDRSLNTKYHNAQATTAHKYN